jgi:Rrf2 family transcriptional regulator, iron-sulfur cluster assembly transcription factor
MIRYGKSTQNAIAAMSRLAEVYEDGLRLSSHDIAKARHIPQTLAAKLLTQLSQAGLVSGAPGPRGGYSLARTPAEITLMDITAVFERTDDRITCPFGAGWCGNNEPCPIHDQLVELDRQTEQFLNSTTLDRFIMHNKAGH